MSELQDRIRARRDEVGLIDLDDCQPHGTTDAANRARNYLRIADEQLGLAMRALGMARGAVATAEELQKRNAAKQ